MTDEIKRTARRQLAEHGAPNLSLRAVAREMGLVSSAVYRYFASRDELLTALIIDAYNALGDAAETAEAAAERPDLIGRFRAVCHAIRDWALANPHEYALTYGSPVPGYHAPMDTIGPATRVTNVLSAIVVDGVAAGILRSQLAEWLETPVREDIVRMGLSDVAPAVMARGLIAWTEIFGAVSFELFGRLDNVIFDRDAWFEHQVNAMARYVGLRP
jgi:AcrR family transcriptional regulator